MKRLVLILLALYSLCGCTMQLPPKDIQESIVLIHSATEDISQHNLKLSRERLGELMSDLALLEAKKNADKDTLRALKERIALESENVESLKELPLALGDLELWAKGE